MRSLFILLLLSVNGVSAQIGDTIFYDGSDSYSIVYQKEAESGEIIVTYSSTGELSVKEIYIDDSKTGSVYWYFPDGQVRASCAYENGNKNGICEYYYETGTLSSRLEYEDNLIVGIRLAFFRSGELQRRLEYTYGLKNGIDHFYYKNGVQQSNETYSYGTKKGERIIRDTLGNLVNGEITLWDRDSTSFVKFNCRNGRPDGNTEQITIEGQLLSTGTYVEGRADGDFKSYKEDGSLKSIIRYKEGEFVWSKFDFDQ